MNTCQGFEGKSGARWCVFVGALLPHSCLGSLHCSMCLSLVIVQNKAPHHHRR